MVDTHYLEMSRVGSMQSRVSITVFVVRYEMDRLALNAVLELWHDHGTMQREELGDYFSQN